MADGDGHQLGDIGAACAAMARSAGESYRAALPPRHPGIAYQEIVFGAEHFGCERLMAKISSTACAAMWREGNHAQRSEKTERRALCRACPVGASHAGVPDANLSHLVGALICARCFRGAERLISHNICVSCYNRQREHIRGKNAKGKPPVKVGALVPRQISYCAGRTVMVVRAAYTRSQSELVIGALRDERLAVRFAWRREVTGLRQMRLF
jgi:hypothetical protein